MKVIDITPTYKTTKKFEVLVFPERSLMIPSVVVEDFNLIEPDLVDAMFNTLEAYSGVGLAAPQIGKNIRLCIVSHQTDRLELFNPVITKQENPSSEVEACLSIPRYKEWVTRFNNIEVEYQDRTGAKHALVATGMLARIIQHEVDHLDGILYIDRCSSLKKSLFKKWFDKKVKTVERLRAQLMEQQKRQGGSGKSLEDLYKDAIEKGIINPEKDWNKAENNPDGTNKTTDISIENKPAVEI